MTDDQNPAAETTDDEHVHDENCIIEGFENFGPQEQELTEMLLRVSQRQLEALAWNIILAEVSSLVDGEGREQGYPVRQEMADYWHEHKNLNPEDQTLSSLGYFAGAKAAFMTAVASGFIKLDKVIEALPQRMFPEGFLPPEFMAAIKAGTGMVLALTREEHEFLRNSEDRDAALTELVNRKMDSGEMPENQVLRDALSENEVAFVDVDKPGE